MQIYSKTKKTIYYYMTPLDKVTRQIMDPFLFTLHSNRLSDLHFIKQISTYLTQMIWISFEKYFSTIG